MYENGILEDIFARCGGNATVGIVGLGEVERQALAQKIEDCCPINCQINEHLSAQDSANFYFYLTRENLLEQENEQLCAIIKTGKPYAVLLHENSSESSIVWGQLKEKYGDICVFDGVEEIGSDKIFEILREMLLQFPISHFDIQIPEWMRYLSSDSSAILELITRVKQTAQKICKMKDVSHFEGMMENAQYWQEQISVNVNLATGTAEITIFAKEGIFYDVLSEIAGEKIAGESGLMAYVKCASEAKVGYGKVKDALECAKVNGYGVVVPDDSDLSLESPEVVRHGGNVGIKLRATAPSYHIIKVDVLGEANPVMGNATDSEEIVKGIMAGFETNPEQMWETNVFGKSLKGMVKDGLSGKVNCMQPDTKAKLRKTVTRIINEGKGGVICILL